MPLDGQRARFMAAGKSNFGTAAAPDVRVLPLSSGRPRRTTFVFYTKVDEPPEGCPKATTVARMATCAWPLGGSAICNFQRSKSRPVSHLASPLQATKTT